MSPEQTLQCARDLAARVVATDVRESRNDMRSLFLRDMTAAAPSTELYNRFIYAWGYARGLHDGLLYVETGTDRGRSGAHAAEGSPACSKVYSIDIDPACSAQLAACGYPGVHVLTGDSLKLSHLVPNDIDVLFLDSLHEHDHLVAEFALYAPKVKPGGLILLDDIHLDEGMERAWDELRFGTNGYGLHADLSVLHHSGFGAIVWEGS